MGQHNVRAAMAGLRCAGSNQCVHLIQLEFAAAVQCGTRSDNGAAFYRGLSTCHGAGALVRQIQRPGVDAVGRPARGNGVDRAASDSQLGTREYIYAHGSGVREVDNRSARDGGKIVDRHTDSAIDLAAADAHKTHLSAVKPAGQGHRVTAIC